MMCTDNIFRTDGVHFKICCKGMNDDDGILQFIGINPKGEPEYRNVIPIGGKKVIKTSDHAKYCQYCGAKLEFVDKLWDE